jgi:hypothetical protein
MRLYISSRGHAGVSFGWVGAVFYGVALVVYATVWLAAVLVVGVVRGLVWLAGEIARGAEARRQPKLRELV